MEFSTRTNRTTPEQRQAYPGQSQHYPRPQQPTPYGFGNPQAMPSYMPSYYEEAPEPSKKSKSSASGLAFWLTVLAILGGFFGALIFEVFKKKLFPPKKAKPVQKPAPEVIKEEEPEVSLPKLTLEEQHKLFMENGYRTLNGSSFNVGGQPANPNEEDDDDDELDLGAEQ